MAYGKYDDDWKNERSWQYQGYPALSDWMASSNDFFLLRRFSHLQARCLLYLQNEIAMRDRMLNAWDEFARKQQPPGGDSGDIACDPDELPNNPRPRLVREMIPLLQQYSKCSFGVRPQELADLEQDDLVNSFSQLKAKETARPHQIRNIENLFHNNDDNLINPKQQHFRDHPSDLFPIVSKPAVPLVSLLHRQDWTRQIFKLRDRTDKASTTDTTYSSARGIETATSLIILSTGLAMAFGSIWWLNYVKNDEHRLGIITVSGTIFTALAYLAAGPRPFEILAAFAAYLAVLMIYLQISS
jgi:hypothetical protein